MAKKRLYIPITRSGSSILASVLTQLLEAARAERRQKAREKLAKGEWGGFHAFIHVYPVLFLFLVLMGILVLWAVVSGIVNLLFP